MNKATFIYLPETASTNTYLKMQLDRQLPAEATVVYTSRQTSGRGQVGSGWEAEPGKNLTFSILLLPHHIPVNRQFILSQLTALALHDVLSEETDGISIKWPNDIYYKDKKIAGILIENTIEGNRMPASVVGIGVNVNQQVFVGDAPNPISLRQITGKVYDLPKLMERIVTRLLFLYKEVSEKRQDIIVARYMASLYRKGSYYPFCSKRAVFDAMIVDVEPSGALVLQMREGGRQSFWFKEVVFVL
jgi:BirA family biotin operon repressor/biotin-[acetyl-CoA-carboxylase] ligase